MLAVSHIVVSTSTDYTPLISSLIVAITGLAVALTAFIRANTSASKSDTTSATVDHNSRRIDEMQNGTLTDIQRRLTALEASTTTPPTVTP